MPPGLADPEEARDRRLGALADYEILDSDAEREFDDIVFLAKKLCNVPVALISLVDRDRQWFKARVGFDACETSLEQSVCQHGLSSRDLLVIPDLTIDPRTKDNTLVTAGPEIRFYAGAPLTTPGGVTIGMLCVIDTEVRPAGLDDDQRRAIGALATQVISQLELRKTLRQQEQKLIQKRNETDILRRAMARLEMAEEAGEVGAFETNDALRTLAVSRQFCQIVGIDPVGVIARDQLVKLVPGTEEIDALMEGGEDVRQGEFQIVRARDGARRWISVRSRDVHAMSGARKGVAGIVSDVTDQRQINEEISHRLKNTLALVQAIAGHTLRGLADPGPVHEFNRRVSALATAHDILLSDSRAAASIHKVGEGVLSRLAIEDRVEISGTDAEMNSRSVLILSMLLHELGTNAMKYGALSVDGGHVELTTSTQNREDGDWIVIDWREIDGPEVSEPETLGLGTRLIQRGLSADGEAELNYGAGGFSARIASPLNQVSS